MCLTTSFKTYLNQHKALLNSTNNRHCIDEKQTTIGLMVDLLKLSEIGTYYIDFRTFHDPWGTSKYYFNDLKKIGCCYGIAKKLLGGCA